MCVCLYIVRVLTMISIIKLNMYNIYREFGRNGRNAKLYVHKLNEFISNHKREYKSWKLGKIRNKKSSEVTKYIQILLPVTVTL